MTAIQVKDFFSGYASRMNVSLSIDPIDAGWLSQAFTEHFIGASANGIQAGNNNDEFKSAITEGITFYRSLGIRSMIILGQEVQMLDDLHAMARVQWTCLYDHKEKSGEITFVNYYLVQGRSPDSIKIFAYVTGDEVEAFRKHGLL